MEAHKKRKQGRPRSVESQENILKAAMLLAEEMGYSNVTLQLIAHKAGAGRQTIYRWWDSKADLYMEALAIKFQNIASLIPAAHEDSLKSYLNSLYEEILKTREILLGITCHSLSDERFKSKYRTRIEERRNYISDILISIQRNSKKTSQPSIDAVTDMMIGMMWYRLIFQNLPLDQKVIEEQIKIIDLLLK